MSVPFPQFPGTRNEDQRITLARDSRPRCARRDVRVHLTGSDRSSTRAKGHRRGWRVLAGVLSLGFLQGIAAGTEPTSNGTSAGTPHPNVVEIHAFHLRQEGGAVKPSVLGDLLDAGVIAVSGEEFTLDGWQKLLRGSGSCGVELVTGPGAGSRGEMAEMIAGTLERSGLDPARIVVWPERASDPRTAGPATSARDVVTKNPGTESSIDRGTGAETPDRGPAKWSEVVSRRTERTVVLATLAANGDRMAPFALDAALQALDPETREAASKDPGFAARLAVDPIWREHVILIIGDLVSVSLEGGSGTPGRVWDADEILVATDPLAAERIGYRILNNTRRGRGLPPLAPHPVLEAARKLGLSPESVEGIEWVKVAF